MPGNEQKRGKQHKGMSPTQRAKLRQKDEALLVEIGYDEEQRKRILEVPTVGLARIAYAWLRKTISQQTALLEADIEDEDVRRGLKESVLRSQVEDLLQLLLASFYVKRSDGKIHLPMSLERVAYALWAIGIEPPDLPKGKEFLLVQVLATARAILAAGKPSTASRETREETAA